MKDNLAWPYHIDLPNVEVINCAEMASGNALISRNLVHKISETLKTTDPNNIMVMVMWSNPNRFEHFINKNDLDFSEYCNLLKDGSHLTNMILTGKLNTTHPDSNWVKSGGGFGIWKTDSKIIDDNFQYYFDHFHNEEYQMMQSVENMLRVQWFCENKGIKLINMTWMNIFTEIEERGSPLKKIYMTDKPKFNLLDQPNITHLSEMIDWDTWWFHNIDGGLADWCKDRYPDEPFEYHPTTNLQYKFTKVVIEPFIKNNITAA